MGVDYFCNGVFGVRLDAYPELQSLQQEITKYRDEVHACLQDETDDVVASTYELDAEMKTMLADGDNSSLMISLVNRKFLQEVFDTLNIPPMPGFTLHYTGSDDDRPGRCHTPAGLWLLGIGMFASAEELCLALAYPPSKLRNIELHNWVEC